MGGPTWHYLSGGRGQGTGGLLFLQEALVNICGQTALEPHTGPSKASLNTVSASDRSQSGESPGTPVPYLFGLHGALSKLN